MGAIEQRAQASHNLEWKAGCRHVLSLSTGLVQYRAYIRFESIAMIRYYCTVLIDELPELLVHKHLSLSNVMGSA